MDGIVIKRDVISKELCTEWIKNLGESKPFGYNDGDNYDKFKITRFKPSNQDLKNKFFEIISNVVDIPVDSIALFTTLKYSVGSSLDLHADGIKVDNYGNVTLLQDYTHSGILFLNDSYTGGSLEFPELGLTCRPTIGTAVIYPSGLNYKHKVTPVQSGERYVFIFRYNLK